MPPKEPSHGLQGTGTGRVRGRGLRHATPWRFAPCDAALTRAKDSPEGHLATVGERNLLGRLLGCRQVARDLATRERQARPNDAWRVAVGHGLHTSGHIEKHSSSQGSTHRPAVTQWRRSPPDHKRSTDRGVWTHSPASETCPASCAAYLNARAPAEFLHGVVPEGRSQSDCGPACVQFAMAARWAETSEEWPWK